MYQKKQLQHFANQIPDSKDRKFFRDRIAAITFKEVGDHELCTGEAISDSLELAGIKNLSVELASRIIEFVKKEELVGSA